MKIDVSRQDELFQCPELPLGLSPYDLTLEIDGVESPTVFAVDTDEGVVKWYKTEPGTLTLDFTSGSPVVLERKYRKFTVRWDNRKGLTGELTFAGKN